MASIGVIFAARTAGKEVVASFGSPFLVPANLSFLPSDLLVDPDDFPEAPETMIVFDAGSSFRDEMYPDYKATREKMPDDLSASIGYIRRIVTGFRDTCVELEGYEADDVIGTLAVRAREAGLEAVIVSGDLTHTSALVGFGGNHFANGEYMPPQPLVPVGEGFGFSATLTGPITAESPPQINGWRWGRPNILYNHEPFTHTGMLANYRLSDTWSLLGGFTREMKVLVISGIWCGDCVAQGPLLHHIASANRAKVAAAVR